MSDLTIPDEAWLAAADAAKPGWTNCARDALVAAAPLIVAAALDRWAAQFALESREADDRVQDHVKAGNQTGANVAVVTSEIYESVGERLREHATELRGA